MKYNTIQKLLSAAMLLAFTSSSVMAANTYGAYSNYTSSPSKTSINTDVRLTNSNAKINLSLRDSDVKQVLRMFADKVGMNVVFHTSVSGKVTLDLVDMPINDAFNLVLQIAGLNYYTQNNTLIVVAKDSADNAAFSKQEMMVFPIKYVSAAKIADFLNKNVFGMKKPGMSSIDAATVNSATNEVIIFGMPSDAAIVEKIIAQFDREPITRNFAVNHTTPAEMADMICNMLLPSRGAESADKDSSKEEGESSPMPGIGTGGAAGIITGGAADAEGSSGGGIKLGEGVVACSVSQSAIGSAPSAFDVQNLSIAYYTQRGVVTLMGGSEAQAQMIEKFIKMNDVKQPQAYLEMSIVELNEEGSKEFQNNWQVYSENWGVSFSNGKTSGGRPTTPYGTWYDVIDHHFEPGYKAADGTWHPATYQETPYKTQNPFRGSYISWQMSYLIENRKARVLANPKLLITNGQESVIDLTQDYVEKVTSEFLSSSSNGIGATGTVQRTYTIGEDKGIKVTLTPFISPDGYVTMNIKPEYATEAGQVTTLSETGDRDIAATLLSRRNLDLKNVRIKDGETLVIGGLIQETDQKVVQKIPVLGDLPIIGAAFRSSSTTKTKSELVIMITPKIINDGEGSVADSL
jgi:type II secretory pathway component GspD/PulD (secretin)